MATSYRLPAARTPGSLGNLGLWALQVLMALCFLIASMPKLFGAQGAIAMFGLLGLGQWFRVFTGLVEITGAALLLSPRLCGVGALLLSATMLGAIIAHATRLGGFPWGAILLLIFTTIIVWGRRNRILRLVGRG